MMVYNTITWFGYLCICVIQLFSKKEGRITYATTRNQYLVVCCMVIMGITITQKSEFIAYQRAYL